MMYFDSLREKSKFTLKINSLDSFGNNSLKNVHKYADIYEHIVDSRI